MHGNHRVLLSFFKLGVKHMFIELIFYKKKLEAVTNC